MNSDQSHRPIPISVGTTSISIHIEGKLEYTPYNEDYNLMQENIVKQLIEMLSSRKIEAMNIETNAHGNDQIQITIIPEVMK